MELTDLLTTPPEGFHFLVNLQLSSPTVHGFLIGPPATPYEGGLFSFSVSFPADYPFKPPILRQETYIVHPRVRNDRVYLDLLIWWAPNRTLRDVLQEFREALEKPDFEGFFSQKAVDMFQLEAKEATLLHAH